MVSGAEYRSFVVALPLSSRETRRGYLRGNKRTNERCVSVVVRPACVGVGRRRRVSSRSKNALFFGGGGAMVLRVFVVLLTGRNCLYVYTV